MNNKNNYEIDKEESLDFNVYSNKISENNKSEKNDKDKVITVSNLSVSLDETEILDNVSLDVYSKEFVSILGANGSGKTTLLKTLCKIIDEYDGEIYIKNKLLTEYKLKELVRIQSYVSQVNVLTNFTVFEFVLMSRYSYFHAFSSVSRIDIDKVNRSLELTETSNLAKRMISTLSGGERQRVIIASALVQDSQIILLDEPTTYLDPRYKHEINELIFKLHKNLDITIVNVTHNINEAVKYSDRIICLKNGKIFSNEKKDSFIENGIVILEEVFDVEFKSVVLKENDNLPIYIN